MATNFRDLLLAEQAALEARLSAVRAAIVHAGEKGTALEHTVGSLLRSWLPQEYGVGSGFVARPTGEGVELSPQLDVVIYDALRSGPLARLETCEVYPLEGVLGYVEVKSSLRREMTAIAERSAQLRGWCKRHFLSYGGPACDGPQDWCPLYCFVFAFEYGADSAPPADLGLAFGRALARVGPPVEIAGAYVGGSFVRSQRPRRPTRGHHPMNTSQEHGLGMFKWRMLMDLTRFPRMPQGWVPELGKYNFWD